MFFNKSKEDPRDAITVSSVLRILHQDAAMSPNDMIYTLPAPPGPPVRSAPVLTATTVWAPPTAGELQSYTPARSSDRQSFFGARYTFYTENYSTKNTYMTHDSLIRTIILQLKLHSEPGLKTLS